VEPPGKRSQATALQLFLKNDAPGSFLSFRQEPAGMILLAKCFSTLMHQILYVFGLPLFATMKNLPFTIRHIMQEDKTSALTARQYQHLLDSIFSVVFILDVNGRFLFVNAASLAVWGYAPDELIGTSCLDIVFEEDRKKTTLYLKDQVAGVDLVHFQNRFYKKDGSLVSVSWAGRWDEKDQAFYCVVQDVAERRKPAALLNHYKEELQKQNEDMTSILERITDGFYALDQHWRVIYWNKEAEWMLGKPREMVLGKNLWELFPDAAGSVFFEHYLKAFNEKTPVYFEGYYAPREMWAELSVYPSAFGLSVFFKNINERKRLERELKEQQRQMTAAIIAAQEKERSLISKELHDNVNQLLTSAKLYAGLGRDGVGSTAAMIEKTISLLQEAIDEIRKLSKCLSAPFLNEVALEDSVRELVEIISNTNRISISLNTEISTQGGVSEDVKLAVYRIVQEHLTNILKHAEATAVDVELRQADEKVTLVITDNGKGFDTCKRSPGVGISNMRSRTESLMGVFCLDSESGKGCRLFVQLPLSHR
jgi:PAS domain S-box-containing protein